MAKKKGIKEDFLPEICKMRHEAINKEMERIKENQKKENKNLKDKIVLSEKRIGNKIDNLAIFDDSLKGNGDPGIWESVRIIKRDVRINKWLIIGFIVLMVGGRFFGVTLDHIGEFFKRQITTKIVVEKSVELIVEYPNDMLYIFDNDNFYSYMEKKNLKEKMEKIK